MVTYILALMLLNVPGQRPDLVAPFKDQESCMKAATRMNSQNEALRSDEARQAGAEYVCLKVERVMV